MNMKITNEIVDDGQALATKVTLLDQEGLRITSYTAWPSQVALPTEVASDATPGPSSFNVTAMNPPTLNADGSFTVQSVAPVTPPPVPLPAGWGQGVNFQVGIDSGLTGQTAPITEDAGTFNIDRKSVV